MIVILVMVDLGVIFGARIYTAIYALYRVAGKYVYASITQSPNTIKNYLGLTLLSRYGVSLVFTGAAASVPSQRADYPGDHCDSRCNQRG